MHVGTLARGLRRTIVLAVLPLAAVACQSISDCLKSPSDSISNSVQGISRSSGSGGGSSSGDLYRADVRAYTVACLGNGKEVGDGAEFVRGLGRIAEQHGITDWESSPDTATAIREAVASGAVDASALASVRDELPGLAVNGDEAGGGH